MRPGACAGVIALAALACATEPIELARSYGRQVTFHSANGSVPVVFEGQGTSASRLQVVVPGLVPLVEQVTVEFAPE